MNGLALCSGVGGLELGVRIATRGNFRVVCHVEREAYSVATLVARMEDQILDRAPIWDDITTFDGHPWRGAVDCITAGIPCQPYSLAGEKAGHADERALWPELVRLVEECEPAFVFIENVPAFLKYLEPVWSCLSGLGFRLAPPLLQTATWFGAPHLRERLFVLAAHPDREPERFSRTHVGGWRSSGCGDPTPSDSNRVRLQSEWRGWVFNPERQTLRHDSNGCDPGCRICGSHWQAESPPVRVDAGFPGRLDELRAIGNSVNPDMAAAAWSYLMARVPFTSTGEHS